MNLQRAVIEVWDLIFAYTRLDLHRQGTGAKPDDAIPLFPEGARHHTHMSFRPSISLLNNITSSAQSRHGVVV